ncbi:SMC family ATPase [Lachnospiraceae bacterium 54-53]
MKPLKLVMSAFGSYGGRETVDFETIDHGIFLITGDTGAGKTTIFDAVSYALFGETSGQKREASMMRSQYASEDEDTYVSLRFSERGSVYEITRSPAYLRVSKRKNKNGEYSAVMVPAKARLLMPDGLEYAGSLRDINQKIQEIMGVDQSQFSQIAMIAQGDYLRLLHATSRERKEIFSRIFNTGIYSRIQMKLKELNSLLYGSLEDNRKLCFHELGNVELLEESPYGDAWRELLEFKETRTEEIRELLSRVLEEIEEKERRLHEEQEEKRRLLAETEGRLSRAAEINRLFDGLERSEAELKILEGQAESRERAAKRLKAARQAEMAGLPETRFLDKAREYQAAVKRKEQLEKELEDLKTAQLKARKEAEKSREASDQEIPELLTLIARLDEAMPLYARWRAMEEACLKKHREEEEAGRHYRKMETELAGVKEQLAANDKRRELLEEKAKHLPEAREKKAGLSEKLQALEGIESAVKVLEADTIKKGGFQVRAADAQKDYERAEQAYNHMYREFLAVQAGIMAEKLTEGQPCPVCGSIHHPSRAELAEGAVTQELAEQAKEARDQAEERRSKATEAVIKILESCRHQEEQIRGETRKWFLEAYSPEQLKARLPEEIMGCRKALEEAGAREQEALKAVQMLEEILEAGKTGRSRIEELEPAKEEALGIWQEKKLETASLLAEAKNLRERLPAHGEKEAEKERERLKNRKDALLKASELAEERYRHILEEGKEKKGRLASEEENREALRTAAENAENAYHSALEKLGFASEEDYLKAKAAPETMKQWEEDNLAYERAVLKARTVYGQYREQTRGRERMETDRWMQEAAGLRDEQKRLQDEGARLTGIRSRAVQAADHLKRLWKEREQLEDEYRLYHTLFQTANGKMAGAVSLDFQTYVQRQYFSQMIQAANQRLKVMTDGQFLLQCRDMDALGKQGEVGLDLDVYSMATDKIRDVKTLSGGESFMAALAMALGMADIIQRTAGNVRMDALFIDEGFGSLDEESRLKAVRILQELAGEQRLIGIISHVTELKEQIGKKLLVRKTEKGSRIQWDPEMLHGSM